MKLEGRGERRGSMEASWSSMYPKMYTKRSRMISWKAWGKSHFINIQKEGVCNSKMSSFSTILDITFSVTDTKLDYVTFLTLNMSHIMLKHKFLRKCIYYFIIKVMTS